MNISVTDYLLEFAASIVIVIIVVVAISTAANIVNIISLSTEIR
jgi:hypothetical protein